MKLPMLAPAIIKGVMPTHLADERSALRTSVAALTATAPALPASLVYTLGTLSYTFATGARRDLFVQEMAPATPFVRSALLTYLAEHPSQAEMLTWIITVDHTPIYALRPGVTWGRKTYAHLLQFLAGVPDDEAVQVSVPGRTADVIGLLSGEVVPVVQPALPGMYKWSIATLQAQLPATRGFEMEQQQQINQRIDAFQHRVYTQLRNRGRTAQERALNYAVTEAYQLLYKQMQDVKLRPEVEHLELSDVDVKPSPICRPDSAPDCWDVELRFFNPDQHLTHPRRVYRLTVDVSSIIPITIGETSEWLRYD